MKYKKSNKVIANELVVMGDKVVEIDKDTKVRFVGMSFGEALDFIDDLYHAIMNKPLKSE